MNDHDQLFKDLLSEFSMEFMELFFPELATRLDKSLVVSLDKELATDLGPKKAHRADLVLKVWDKVIENFVLLHFEIESTRHSKFPERMLHYHCWLMKKYAYPIIPIAIYTFRTPRTKLNGLFESSYAHLTVIHFEFQLIQLNQLHWRKFLGAANPAASALMACAMHDNHERVDVKLECLRSLAQLGIPPKKEAIVQLFIDAYLPLDFAEEQNFLKLLSDLTSKERTKVMTYVTTWERRGIELGRAQGKAEGIAEGKAEGIAEATRNIAVSQLKRIVGPLPDALVKQIHELSENQLDSLTNDLLGFRSLQHLIDWLNVQEKP